MSEVPESRPVKFTITHYRQQQHSHEAFIDWIVEEHLPLAIPVFEKYGVIKYCLFVTPPSQNGALKEEIGAFRPTWDFATFDCFIEYMLPDMETIKKIMSDPDWQVAVKDQDKWVDVPKALVSVGYCTGNLLDKNQ
ncbi:Dimeric alpha-beta barrel [Penicillium atrosanguineum]|uniref:Dimeric alpha-beta barrel n=1 Tax=Penicillium atrosanguineum TaxID=1132637 RepID=A0A9W9H7X8_9EURO|nr:Dimeric alpha-beta barrel [Penicillium atrosanguineum]KAJ5122564.1 Dimeric alpha-beta barrel [Penicillium atrosanguineum]KAJ5140289.1 Dimeric alpha-beta barrel [Penicillium atrosanguineum]KAJ5310205.1 Dimeric alpha-beta barrel [Penicillium atrosanguineum]KAJ5315721.1 Dimeric alpha-beta barrel [Penicillium atrosanguineum]